MNHKPQNQGAAFVLLSLLISNINIYFLIEALNSSRVVARLVYL